MNFLTEVSRRVFSSSGIETSVLRGSGGAGSMDAKSLLPSQCSPPSHELDMPLLQFFLFFLQSVLPLDAIYRNVASFPYDFLLLYIVP
jgi:hypothetical protein